MYADVHVGLPHQPRTLTGATRTHITNEGDPIEPEGDPIDREGDRIEPEGDPIEPEGDPIEPEGDPIEPEGDRIEPEGDPIEPEGDRIEPEGDPIDLAGDLIEPEGDPIDREGDPIDLAGDRIEPEGDPIDREGDRIEPEGDPIDLAGDRIEPEGDPIDLAGDPIEPKGGPAGHCAPLLGTNGVESMGCARHIGCSSPCMHRVVATFALLLMGCNQPAHTLQRAATSEVYSTASCPSIEVSHVPSSDVATTREDVYVAEGCGTRWRMTCEEKLVRVCPRRRYKPSLQCHNELQWSCANIQSESAETDEALRARVTHDDMNVLGT